jgi:hypothetical protein
MKYSSNRDLSDRIEVLIKQGWKYEVGGKHGKVISPTTPAHCFIVSKSPSDYMACNQFEREVRRKFKACGLQNPFEKKTT